jgi:hypothetical protein
VVKVESIQGYADLGTVAESLVCVMETMIDEKSIEESKKSTAKALIKSWVKKALPFIEQGLSAATVSFIISPFKLNTKECYPSTIRFDCLSCSIHCAGAIFCCIVLISASEKTCGARRQNRQRSQRSLPGLIDSRNRG